METTFNKYKYLQELINEVKEGIADGTIKDWDGVCDLVDNSISNEVIYYDDSLQIISQTGLYDWSGIDDDLITDVTRVAYWGLHNFVFEESEDEFNSTIFNLNE
jgi:hypothetical protein